MGNLFSSLGPVSFSGRTLLRVVGYENVPQKGMLPSLSMQLSKKGIPPSSTAQLMSKYGV